MGLIKNLTSRVGQSTGVGGIIGAASGAVGGALADQWKEFFYCDSIDKDILIVKGQKRTNSRSVNYKGNDNIISNGSVVAVADGQCMIIVDQGKVVEFCAEPGEYTYNTSTEPSIFTGKLGTGIKDTFKTIGKRVTFGGDTGKDQRVYYFNLKEIVDNKFGTPTPFMFDVVNKEIGMRRTVQVRCSGIYTYRITDPILFYANVAGNVENIYRRSEIDSTLKTEFVDALQPAFASLSEMELRPTQIPGHTSDLKNAVNEALATTWAQHRGITVASIAMNPISLTEEDMKKINQMEDAATLGKNPFMMAGRMTDSTAAAMEAAANNPNGAMNGFVGMGMPMGMAGGGFAAAQDFYKAGVRQNQMAQPVVTQPVSAVKEVANGWKCSCGAMATGKFCNECGAAKPVEDKGWTCAACGTVNKGKFCNECGAKKPVGAPLYRCDKCGWEPEDPYNPPKFCSECGDIFDDSDLT